MLHFPSVGHQVVSSLIHFLGLTIITHCLSQRLSAERIWSFSSCRDLSWARVCVLLIFLDSWCFIFSSGVLIFGAGLELHPSVCAAGIFICIGFYSTSKVLIYLFLAEKVYIVWQGKTRRSSPVYLLAIATISAYAGITAVLLVGRLYRIRQDGVCIIGLKSYASIALLSYDLYINIFLTGLFLWPICRAHVMNPKIRRVASRTLIASGAALTTSAINIAVLTVLHGQELGWVCLGSCALDVTFNAISLFWVSHSSPSSKDVQSTASKHRPYPIEVIGSTHSLRPLSSHLGVRIKLDSDPVCLLDLPKPSSPMSDTFAEGSGRPRRVSGLDLSRVGSNLEAIEEAPGEVHHPDDEEHQHTHHHRPHGSLHLDSMMMTPWTHLEIPTEVEVEVIHGNEEKDREPTASRTGDLEGLGLFIWRRLRKLSQNSRTRRAEEDLGMNSIAGSDSLQITVTRTISHEYRNRPYGYDPDSQRMYPSASNLNVPNTGEAV